MAMNEGPASRLLPLARSHAWVEVAWLALPLSAPKDIHSQLPKRCDNKRARSKGVGKRCAAPAFRNSNASSSETYRARDRSFSDNADRGKADSEQRAPKRRRSHARST